MPASGKFVHNPAAAESDVRISKSVVAHHRINPFPALIPATATNTFDLGYLVAIVAVLITNSAGQGTGIPLTILLNPGVIPPLVPALVPSLGIAIATTWVQQDIEKVVDNPIKTRLRCVKSLGRSRGCRNSDNQCENQCSDNFFHRGLHLYVWSVVYSRFNRGCSRPPMKMTIYTCKYIVNS
jgi:hypothetical protein